MARFIGSQDVSPNSKRLYTRTLRQYFNWVSRRGYDLRSITREEILEYKQDLLDEEKSSLTVGSYITSVRRFYEWAEALKHYPNVAKGVRTPRRRQQFRKQPLTPAQVSELLDYFRGNSPRDYAIVSLLVRTGLRTVEVSRATVCDITFKASQRVLLVHGKGRAEKDNFVVLTAKAYAPIADYLATRSALTPGSALFPSDSNNSSGAPLSTRTISGIVKAGLQAIGLDDKAYTAHSLRHTTAVNILRSGGSLETAQMTLRHSNPATTQIYTATLEESRRLENSGEALIDNLY
jgi:integrase/recombinase XerC/integrase/recombinase XerD